MLVNIDYRGKEKTKYKCDMCNQEIINPYTFRRTYKKKTKKVFDLCENCQNILNKSIKRYNLKHCKNIAKQKNK